MDNVSYIMCPDCHGEGKKSKGISKKALHAYQHALNWFEANGGTGEPPAPPKGHLYTCKNCRGTGLLPSPDYPGPDKEKYPHVAIIGAGIGGVALAVACLHRKIPFTLFERDSNFNARSQGYGLTLQQASKAIEGFGITSLKDGVVSTRHLVHTPEAKVVGQWGMRKWLGEGGQKQEKRSNIHIARQSLRMALLEQLSGPDAVQWNHQLLDLKQNDDNTTQLTFQTAEGVKTVTADLVVGADGIRSQVSKILIGDERTPLRYLDCIVILGICPLAAINSDSTLLDGTTVFQTANGSDRIYVMPYTTDAVMWQLSFPIAEADAKALSTLGPAALKAEACRRIQWHSPLPQILEATPGDYISGYPVYDRELLKGELLHAMGAVTLIGDAAHPMSPFKGQGANQALLDALKLAREITRGCRNAHWKETGIRKAILNNFEAEMIARSAVKVKDSALAAEFLHSEIVLDEADSPRGRCMKNRQ